MTGKNVPMSDRNQLLPDTMSGEEMLHCNSGFRQGAEKYPLEEADICLKFFLRGIYIVIQLNSAHLKCFKWNVMSERLN